MNITADEATIFEDYIADTDEFAELCAAFPKDEDFVTERVIKIVGRALKKKK